MSDEKVVLMDGAADDEPYTPKASGFADAVLFWNAKSAPPMPEPAYSFSVPAGGIPFDGRKFFAFSGWQSDTSVLYQMHLLDLAHRGRGGDAGAVELLTAFGVVVNDADGHPYWPAVPLGGR